MDFAQTTTAWCEEFASYVTSGSRRPLFIEGDSQRVLATFPKESVDCCVTSPPYWGHRAYACGGIGQEATFDDYIDDLLAIVGQLRRVLKPTGSFWLNIGDAYHKKSLVGVPWRVAIAMIDKQGWILRNSVIWNKVKGSPDNAKDKLRNVYEHVFHFVRSDRYYYDADAIRTKPRQAKVVNGAIVSATGVSGIRYRRQIELSTALTDEEKSSASKALEDLLEEVRGGTLPDFRMIIRGQQRATHSDSEQVSGRAHELAERGFYFLRYHPNGAKPGDVWDIVPEDTQNRRLHFFLNQKCLKNRKSEADLTIGTCTMTFGRTPPRPVMICPFRLLERNQIFTDCVHLLKLHEPGNELRIVPEVAVPGGSMRYRRVGGERVESLHGA